jgi:hypothetical protein
MSEMKEGRLEEKNSLVGGEEMLRKKNKREQEGLIWSKYMINLIEVAYMEVDPI